MINTVTAVLTAGAALGFLVFVARFLRTGWHRTEVGRNLMAFMAVFGTLITLALVYRWIPLPKTAWELVRCGAYLLINWVVWWRVFLLFRVQREGGHPRKPEDAGKR